jgi:hypothetical protein
MKDSVVQKIDIISTIATSMFAGGGLMVDVTFGPRWSRLEPAQLVQDFPQDWIYIAATIIPITLVQTLLLGVAEIVNVVRIAISLDLFNQYTGTMWLVPILFFPILVIAHVYIFHRLIKKGNEDFRGVEST